MAERVEKEASRKRKYECQKAEDQTLQKTAWARLEEHLGEERAYKGKDQEEEYVPPNRKRRRMEPPPLALPRDVITHPLLLESMARCGTTNSSMADHLATIIKIANGNLGDYNLSPDNVRKQKSKKLKAAAESKREAWKPPPFPCISWDEKQIERHGKKENRMPIVISGDERPPTHIESVELPDGKGATIAHGVTEAARKWGVHGGEGGVKPVMCMLDTTASNSGNYKRIYDKKKSQQYR